MTTATQQARPRGGSSGDWRTQGGYGTGPSGVGDGGGRSQPELENAERRARGLGWFSIGLGLAQIAAPRSVARMIGVDDDDKNRNAMFAVGVREIAAGVGILTRPRPAGWVWSRVGGDAMDLALLTRGMRSDDNDRGRVAAATAAVVGVTILDLLTAQQLSQATGQTGRLAGSPSRRQKGIHVRKAVTINRTPQDIYSFWRNFENLPRFMYHLDAVQRIDDRRSHWRAKGPAGLKVEWDAEVIEDRPNELIAWRSLENADVPNWGSVRFVPAPGDQGTEVHVDLHYDPPGGAIGAAIAKLFGEEPNQQVSGDLRRLKQLLEAGEVVKSDATLFRGPHPARPPEMPISPRQTGEGVLQEGAVR